MSDRTSLKERIARIEAIPLIYGSISSGAEGRYITKKDFPKLLVLTEGGYATDIFLKIDEKRERVIIEDILPENYDSFKDEMMDGANDFLGVLDSGVSSGLEKSLEKVGKENKAVFWCNGIWSIIQEHFQENDLFIPIELALRIINRAGISNKNDLLTLLSTKKFENEKFDSISSKQLADKLDMSDLYSIWKFDNRITCMLNTDMKDGPYKIQRIYGNVNIKVSVEFIHNESNTSGTMRFKLKNIVSKEDYENAIINSFKEWSGSYKEE